MDRLHKKLEEMNDAIGSSDQFYQEQYIRIQDNDPVEYQELWTDAIEAGLAQRIYDNAMRQCEMEGGGSRRAWKTIIKSRIRAAFNRQKQKQEIHDRRKQLMASGVPYTWEAWDNPLGIDRDSFPVHTAHPSNRPRKYGEQQKQTRAKKRAAKDAERYWGAQSSTGESSTVGDAGASASAAVGTTPPAEHPKAGFNWRDPNYRAAYEKGYAKGRAKGKQQGKGAQAKMAALVGVRPGRYQDLPDLRAFPGRWRGPPRYQQS